MAGCCCSHPWWSASLVEAPGRGKQRMWGMHQAARLRLAPVGHGSVLAEEPMHKPAPLVRQAGSQALHAGVSNCALASADCVLRVALRRSVGSCGAGSACWEAETS